jgi:hypothetical protein
MNPYPANLKIERFEGNSRAGQGGVWVRNGTKRAFWLNFAQIGTLRPDSKEMRGDMHDGSLERDLKHLASHGLIDLKPISAYSVHYRTTEFGRFVLWKITRPD